MHNIFIVMIILLIVIFISYIEQKLLVTTKHIIASKKIPIEMDGISFVVLSDLHNNSYGDKNRRLIKAIEKTSPNFIVIAGDMITKRDSCVPSVGLSLVESLADKYQIYYTNGNHEQGIELNENNTSYIEFKQRLMKKGVIFLNNDSITLTKQNQGLRITGVDIDREFFKRKNNTLMAKGYLDTLIEKGKDTDFQILIAHNPIYFKEYMEWGADLTLSGHIHGGVVRLPIFGGVISRQFMFFPKYDAGLFKENGKEMIISRGLGTHSIKFRLFNRPELIDIKLKRIS